MSLIIGEPNLAWGMIWVVLKSLITQQIVFGRIISWTVFLCAYTMLRTVKS
ncbi:hypothetical protein NEIFLAOT_00781 [Neisseria flavescens NRL30031/H210]|uniref:Uncharacterized protein n=1 Tax=Neisseria flavescens NRL30031/H210 TaxID=546264 RepID=C0ELH5_NEIFL|nr:hypothetical protein NEIFLAOT_00781 [Neisseria flavescens NRL30031/H210]